MAERPSIADRRAASAARSVQRAEITDPAVVMEAAARFLAVRSRSVSETRRRLLVQGYEPGLIETVLDRLATMGYLDDEAFARAWVDSRDRSRPRGASALRQELRRKGVAEDVVREALAQRGRPDSDLGVAAPADEPMTSPGRRSEASPVRPDLDAALRLLARRSTALAREADPRRRRHKAYALLARNGFDPEVCREAVASATDVGGAEIPSAED